jgi:type IV secretion system protein VirD4
MGVAERLLYRLCLLQSRLVGSVHADQLHQARFARLHDLAPLAREGVDRTSLLLGTGRFGHTLQVTPIATRRELGNLLVVAPTRGGKGLLATSQLLAWPHAVIVNDIKGDLFTQTAGYRATLGPVFVIDPTGVGHRYDPLAGKRTEDELLSAATHLLFKPDEGDGAIFTQRATVMLTQLFLAARREAVAPLPYVRYGVRAGLTGSAQRLQTLDPELATQFLDVRYEDAKLSDRFLASAWGTLSARLRPLLTETVVTCFAGSDIAPAELMTADAPVTVYFRWPERDLLALSPLFRLLWTSVIDELITTYDRREGKGCKPVLLLLDEAGRTAIPSLAEHATTVVGRGISLWVAIQSLSQLDAVYGKSRAAILRDNMETQLYYRPSNQETADYLEHCLGRRSAFAKSQTLRDGAQASEGRSEQGVPLMTSQEVKQLRDDDIIGFHRRLVPFKAHRMDWRQSAILRQRHGLPVPSIRALAAVPTLSWQPTLQDADGYISPDGEEESAA